MAEERGDPELRRGLKIFKKRSKRGRRNVFSQRVVNPWNHEKKNVVQERKISGFKAKFDKEEEERRGAREGRGVMLYKLMYRVDNVG